jgi:Na+-transporting methylmalonyl-CoA/oxaloacetate decarboxylase gamma subunit
MLDALWIVLLGMAIIFAVLGILLVVMVLLSKLIKQKAGGKGRDSHRA